MFNRRGFLGTLIAGAAGLATGTLTLAKKATAATISVFKGNPKPISRNQVVSDLGHTVDLGCQCDRLVVRNYGPDCVWFCFDMNGQDFIASASNMFAFQLRFNESINLTSFVFQKIGLRCAPGDIAGIAIIAFEKEGLKRDA